MSGLAMEPCGANPVFGFMNKCSIKSYHTAALIAVPTTAAAD
jgi:hypothetical protein